MNFKNYRSGNLPNNTNNVSSANKKTKVDNNVDRTKNILYNKNNNESNKSNNDNNINSSNKNNVNRKSSQERNIEYKYSYKNSKNIDSPKKDNNLNRRGSQENKIGFKYSNKKSKDITSPKKDNNLNRRGSKENNIEYKYSNKKSKDVNIIRKNSQINTNKKKLLIINSDNTTNKKVKDSYISYIEKECKINRKNKEEIDIIFLNYDEYQNKREEEDFFKIYFIFFFVPKNELLKNTYKIFELEDDIENYNPFIQLGVISVSEIKMKTKMETKMESYIILPQFPFSEYSEIVKKYEKFKERKKDSKYKIITYYPEFCVYKEKDNKIIVKIFYPYVFSEFSNANHEDIISEQFFDDNIYIKSNFFNYLVNIEGYKNNCLENVLSPNVFSSLEFGYFKIHFYLPLDTFGKKVYDKFEKNIDYSEFHKNGMIKIIFEGK
jgi:hypothetical protein